MDQVEDLKQPKAEDAEWKPKDSMPSGSSQKSWTRNTVEAMRKGDVLRIHHDDIKCDLPRRCGLVTMIQKRMRDDRTLEYQIYHEAIGVAVVRRTK